MADFDPPSFSLGFDFDLDSATQQQSDHPSSSHPIIEEDDDDFEIPTRNTVDPDPPRALKRIRRGPEPEPDPEVACGRIGDDDIEEFSSQEEEHLARDYCPSSYPHSAPVRSTSKFPLHGRGVFTTQSTSKRKMIENEGASDIPASTSTKTNADKFTFPKLTVSPLRRFQLLDSDSDSDFDNLSPSDHANIEANKLNSSSKEKFTSLGRNLNTTEQKRASASKSVSEKEDLWEDFYTEKSFNIPTPALDEVCEEYFRSMNNKSNPPSQHSSKVKESYQMRITIDDDDDDLCNTGEDHIPPAHCYFYHDDKRIQNLVRSRLPYFFPLDATNRRNNHPVPSVIDYMSQFNHGEGSKQQPAQKTKAGTSSTRVRKNTKKSRTEVPEESGSWVNPRSSTSIPKDAGKRRVHAVDGQSTGHWFTTPEGKKVYVSRTGQELSGRAAYSHYRKESGKGFKRSGRKKSAAKKKNASKKKYPAKKR